jgi:hypothetical protein
MMRENTDKNRKEVNPKQFCELTFRQFYNGYVWKDVKSGEFMLSCKEKDVIDLDKCR